MSHPNLWVTTKVVLIGNFMTYPNFQKEGLKLVTEASILRNEKKKVKPKIGKRNNKEQ